MRKYIYPLAGFTFAVVMFWVGDSIPTERGSEAVAFVLICLATAFLGFALSNILESGR